MRLIDADALLEKCNKDRTSLKFAVLTLILHYAPTIDAVEVVRCKDCKHRYESECPMYYEEWYAIDEYDRDFRVIDETQDDGFCHCGERREE